MSNGLHTEYKKKVGKDKIILNFTCGILSQSGKILLQKRADKGMWGLLVSDVNNNRCLKR